MAITRKQHYRGSDFNNKDLKDAKSLQLNQDAANPDEAVRLSQSESISDQAAQDILVQLVNDASHSTTFTSATEVQLLAAKQDNLEIDMINKVQDYNTQILELASEVIEVLYKKNDSILFNISNIYTSKKTFRKMFKKNK